MLTHRTVSVLASVICVASLAQAQPVLFQGNAATETAWRAAAGGGAPVPLETFEGYTGVGSPCATPRSDSISALPALGVTLRGVTAGAFPGCYSDANLAHSGTKQLANFGFDVPCANAVDYFIEAAPGRAIRAAGLWQCDPQGDLTIVAQDAAGASLFSFVALINNQSGNSFAGFVLAGAAPPRVSRLRVLGAEGDGWNHLDDLQIVTVCPADFNASGMVTVADIFAFLTAWFAQTGLTGPGHSADFNGDNAVNVTDIFVFLTAWFAGCP